MKDFFDIGLKILPGESGNMIFLKVLMLLFLISGFGTVFAAKAIVQKFEAG